MQQIEILKDNNFVSIKGNIKTIQDSQAIIDTLKTINENVITIQLIDSLQIPSSVLGYILKLYKNGKKINLEVGQNFLYELLKDLNLDSTLNIKKI